MIGEGLSLRDVLLLRHRTQMLRYAIVRWVLSVMFVLTSNQKTMYTSGSFISGLEVAHSGRPGALRSHELNQKLPSSLSA